MVQDFMMVGGAASGGVRHVARGRRRPRTARVSTGQGARRGPRTTHAHTLHTACEGAEENYRSPLAIRGAFHSTCAKQYVK
ncbi:unnamed protein product [Colias eurytheme]|nr:unnamed protein product [Colias eurytheme]